MHDSLPNSEGIRSRLSGEENKHGKNGDAMITVSIVDAFGRARDVQTHPCLLAIVQPTKS
jgi:hypothetical protein